jgi:UDP-N-acetylglucosamine 2-epimerase
MLEENYAVPTWIKSVKEIANPFGDGRAARRIVQIIEEKTGAKKRNSNAMQRKLC